MPDAGATRAVTFSGTATIFFVDDVYNLSSVAMGTPLTFSYTFDRTVVDSNADPVFGDYDSTGAGYGLRVTINRQTYETDLALVTPGIGPPFSFAIIDVPEGMGADSYRVSSGANRAPIASLGVQSIGIGFDDDSGATLGSDALPTTPPALGTLEGTVVIIGCGTADPVLGCNDGGAHQMFTLRARVETLTL